MGLKPGWEQRMIRLTREQNDKLRQLAQARGQSVSRRIREAVELYLRTELPGGDANKHQRVEEGQE